MCKEDLNEQSHLELRLKPEERKLHQKHLQLKRTRFSECKKWSTGTMLCVFNVNNSQQKY